MWYNNEDNIITILEMEMFMTNFIETFKAKGLSNLITIIIIVGFVIVFGMIFGTENELIGVGTITGILMFRQLGCGLDKKQAFGLIIQLSITLATSSLLSSFGLLYGLIANTIAIFSLMYFFVYRIEYKLYIPFLLIYIFAQSTVVPMELQLHRMLAMITSGILFAIVIRFFSKSNDTLTLKEYVNLIGYKSNEAIFCYKMTIGVVIAMAIGDLLQIERTMWISMTVMSILQPILADTYDRMKGRIIGTLAGFVLSFGVLELVPPEYLLVVTAIMTYIYTFIQDYQIKMVFITVNSLNAADGIFGPYLYHSALYRLIYLFAGIAIALAVTLWIKNHLEQNPDSLDNIANKMRKAINL